MTSPRRVALVTGGALGIGRAICRRLAREGVAVAIGHHTHPPDGSLAEIAAEGGTAIAVHLDVTDASSIETAVAAVVAQLGRLDILVNNAGGLLARVPIDEMSDDHWNDVVALNLTSAFACTRAALAHLGSGARIINISSLAAQNGGGPGASAYAAAKAGMIGFTRASAKEVGPRGITVNAVAPGFIDDTPFHATFSTDDAKRSMVSATAVRRPGLPDDVAAAVSSLVAADAGFVTGAVIDLNGGTYFT